jgi:hypothetical protein
LSALVTSFFHLRFSMFSTSSFYYSYCVCYLFFFFFRPTSWLVLPALLPEERDSAQCTTGRAVYMVKSAQTRLQQEGLCHILIMYCFATP